MEESATSREQAAAASAENKPHSRRTSTLEGWVDEHAQFLFRFSLARVRDHNAAEELVQETFLAAVQAIDSYRADASPRTWLVGILRRKIVDRFRKLARERGREPLEANDPAVDALFDGKGRWIKEPLSREVDPTALRNRADFWRVFEDCLQGLPDRLAMAFSMRVMDDIEPEEVCKVLSISSTNLWVMLHRARSRLRVCLEANWFESEAVERA